MERPNFKKLYYLLGNVSQISATGGDGINELNLIKFLNKYFDVYYNNQRIDFTQANLGQNKTDIEAPGKDYDAYYVRNNPIIFKQIPEEKLKIYFASPYDEESFASSDLIACPTESWKTLLEKPNKNWGILYPDDYYTDKAVVLSQKLDPDSIYQKEVEENAFTRYGIDPDSFKICHFGSIRNSCFPSYFLRFYDALSEETKKQISVIFVGTTSASLNILDDIDNFFFIQNIDFTKVNDFINSSDLLLYNQRDFQSEYAGSNKVVEAIVCEKPILACRSHAREYELGRDYPLFYNLRYKPPDNPKNIFQDSWIDDDEVIRCAQLINKLVTSSSFYDEVIDYMRKIDKARFYNTFNEDRYIDEVISRIP